jgi:hypothetical protein
MMEVVRLYIILQVHHQVPVNVDFFSFIRYCKERENKFTWGGWTINLMVRSLSMSHEYSAAWWYFILLVFICILMKDYYDYWKLSGMIAFTLTACFPASWFLLFVVCISILILPGLLWTSLDSLCTAVK